MTISLAGHTQPLLLNISIDQATARPATGSAARADADPGAVLKRLARLASAAEQAGVDSLTLTDRLAGAAPDAAAPASFEPLTLLAHLSALTSRIGLIAGVSPLYRHPYNVARRLASLDHVSHGRAGWQVAATGRVDEAVNFGTAAAKALGDSAYQRALASEYVVVLQQLWDSWDDDARVADKASGAYLDLGKIRRIDHQGAYFRVEGPIDIPRSPQGHALLAQVARREDASDLLIDAVDVVYHHAADPAAARLFGAQLRQRTRAAGRADAAVRALVSIDFTVACAATLVAQLADWSRAVAADRSDSVEASFTAFDGFDLRVAPDDVDAFIEHALPALSTRQAGGSLRTTPRFDPAGPATPTLRERYGLARPTPHQAAALALG